MRAEKPRGSRRMPYQPPAPAERAIQRFPKMESVAVDTKCLVMAQSVVPRVPTVRRVAFVGGRLAPAGGADGSCNQGQGELFGFVGRETADFNSASSFKA